MAVSGHGFKPWHPGRAQTVAYDPEHIASSLSIQRHTVVIVHRNDNGQLAIGSGVLIEIGERRFVATAYHCLREAVLLTEGMAIPQDNTLPAHRIPILKQGGDFELDVGFMEIANNSVIKTVHDHYPCALKQVYIGPNIQQGMVLHICGWPEYSARQVGLSTIERSLEVIMVRCEGRDDNRLHFSFGGKSGQWNDYDEWVEKDTPTPRGFSGGGCWGIIKSKDNELYAPSKHVKLIALQSAWDSVIFGTATLIGEWVRVIVRDYPDLRTVHRGGAPVSLQVADGLPGGARRQAPALANRT
jgi:hypothetical protein